MIIRKPYAFLIKHFKKIHIFMLIISLFIYFTSTKVYSFVREFISLGSYDSYNEPISKYINFFVILCLLALIVISFFIVRLLRKKEKPWKLYLIPLVQYSLLLVAFTMISSYFTSYTGVESSSTLRIWRDLLMISQIVQFFIFIIFIIRIFGIDLNKFNFKLDEEYIELEQSDIGEFELNFNVDKSAFKRLYRKTLRVFNYFYQEHKLLCQIMIGIFIVILGKNSLDYVYNHRSFKQGDTFKTSNGYTVTINNSYYSDKSYNGEIISPDSAFVIVDLTITNNLQSREVDLNKYHIINGVRNYTTTEKMYETEFRDLGKTYEAITLKRGEKVNMIMIFKVNKKIKAKRFVLYYQEPDNLRKIKLKINDLSKVNDKASYSLGEMMPIQIITDEEENISFEDYSIEDSILYTSKICTGQSCSSNQSKYKAPTGYKVMALDFASDTYEGDDMVSFATKYGQILYKNSEGKTMKTRMVSPISETYYGKYLYLKVPEELINSESIIFNFTIRNNKYTYKIK